MDRCLFRVWRREVYSEYSDREQRSFFAKLSYWRNSESCYRRQRFIGKQRSYQRSFAWGNIRFFKPRHQLPLYSKGDILIGANTWIGDNAIILSGVHIGKNCVIGANAVVTKSFDEEGLVIAGNPARIVKRKDS